MFWFTLTMTRPAASLTAQTPENMRLASMSTRQYESASVCACIWKLCQ